MNNRMSSMSIAPAEPDTTQFLADQFARRISARLTQASAALPYPVCERLRAAREQALAQRKRTAVAPAPASALLLQANGSASANWGGPGGAGWWNALASAAALLALLIALVLINNVQDERSSHDMAETDAALLTDDLPPAAYADPGFMQYLKTSAQQPD